MVIVGQHEYAAFCMKYPGESRYQMACQGSELIVGLGKMYCDECGTGKFDMPTKLGNFYDITGTSMVHYNKIDFRKILQKLENEKQLIFNGNKTPLQEIQTKRTLPPIARYIVNIFDHFEVGDKSNHFISQILTQLDLDVWSLHTTNISKLLVESQNVSLQIAVEKFDENSPEYKDCMVQLQELKKAENKSMNDALKVQTVVVNNELPARKKR